MLAKLKSYKFLFSELVKRDFKKKYKRTVLGMIWSVLSPLLNVLVLVMIFVHLFGRTQPHYNIYIFSGTLVMNFYSESTRESMKALMANASIFTKVNVPKSLFILSKSIQTFINFGLTLIIYFVFCIFEGLPFGLHTLSLIYPIFTLLLFNLGVGLTLSALFVFFRDIEYLYSIFLMLLHYVSALFYPVTIVPEEYRNLFYLNPLYTHIKYFREVMIDGIIPSAKMHLLLAGYAIAALLIGFLIYRKYNHEFLYYV